MPNKLIEILYEATKIDEKILEGGFKKYIISGIYTVTDTPNSNNRIYPTDIMNEAVKKLQLKVKKGAVKMALDHPEWTPKLKDTAAIITDISEIGIDKKGYYTAQIVDTAVGKDLKAILDGGGVVGVSTRGYGATLDDQELPGLSGRYTIIQPGFKLESIDFVDIPSVEETEDNMTLEQKGENKMKTIEEIMKAYPELFKKFNDKTEAEKKDLVDKLNEAIKVSNSATSNFNKLAEMIKTIKPDLFVVITESETIKSKDAEILTLKNKISELEVSIKNSTNKISTFESEKIKNAREMELQKIKAEDPDFFKPGMEFLVKKFENCNTAEEIRAVYTSNKELIESLRKSNEGMSDPKTKTPDKKNEGNGLTKEQTIDFELKNKERRSSGLSTMTVESYKKLCMVS